MKLSTPLTTLNWKFNEMDFIRHASKIKYFWDKECRDPQTFNQYLIYCTKIIKFYKFGLIFIIKLVKLMNVYIDLW